MVPAPMNKMAARAKNRKKKLKMLSFPQPVTQFQYYFDKNVLLIIPHQNC